MIEVPSVEADLIGSGLLDSLALVELLFEIEQRFGIDLEFDELEIENFRTVERISDLVARRLGGSPRDMTSPGRGAASGEGVSAPPPHG